MNEFGRILLDWYERHGRDLPWRRTNDPYLVWISEIILQQTRVAQGLDYFLRFVGRFPDLPSLATAGEDEVLKLWQGLGYYSRARNLHAAAKSMADGFPRTYEGVRALKGVGDYTAAAICSISYGLPYAVVDGNVYRVLSRWLGLELPVDSTAGKKEFARVAAELLDREHPGLYNQAIMDFGALQCVPVRPDCPACPLSASCAAYRDGRVAQLPVKQHKTIVSERFFTYIYVRMGAYTYIHKRRGDDIWKNLFELPLIETGQKITEEELLGHPGFRALTEGNGQVVVRNVVRGVRHVLSHRILYADLYEVILPEEFLPAASLPYLKIPIRDLGEYAMPKLMERLIDRIPEGD